MITKVDKLSMIILYALFILYFGGTQKHQLTNIEK